MSAQRADLARSIRAAARVTAPVAALALLAASCSHAVYTQGVRDRYDLTNADVGRLQFYTSEEIVLQREVSLQSKEQHDGALAIEDGIRIEQIEIPSGTPGVALEVQPGFILVGFSRKSPDLALWFGVEPAGDAGADTRPFKLVTLENKLSDPPPFVLRWSKGFLVTWGGQAYSVASGRGAYLTYKMDESFAREKVKQEPPGWKLSEGAPTIKAPAAASSASASAPPPSPSSPAPTAAISAAAPPSSSAARPSASGAPALTPSSSPAKAPR
jgi:hypothetical protein